MIQHRTYSDKKLKPPIDSEGIEQQVKDFLAKGGTIHQVPTGLSGETDYKPKTLSPTLIMKDTKITGMSLRAVAMMIGRSHAWLTKQIQDGVGPRFVLDKTGKKRFDKDEFMDWYRSLK